MSEVATPGLPESPENHPADHAANGWLGHEFLVWLWFRIETKGGEFDIGRDREIGVSFDDFIAFAPLENDETEQTLKKGSPSRCAEASAALKNGRRLTRARLVIAQGEGALARGVPVWAQGGEVIVHRDVGLAA